MPLTHNYHTAGRAWLEHGIHQAQVLERNTSIAEGSSKLWEVAESLIDDAVAKGYLRPQENWSCPAYDGHLSIWANRGGAMAGRGGGHLRLMICVGLRFFGAALLPPFSCLDLAIF